MSSEIDPGPPVPDTDEDRTVVVVVRGGVAEVIRCPSCVAVEIRDLDNIPDGPF